MTDFAWVAESAPLPGFVIRATVVLAMGIVLAWLMRKRSAQVRHRLWTSTLLVVLLLPALAFWAPQWEVPLLPVAARPAADAEAIGLPGPSAELSATPVSEAARTAPLGSDIALTALESPDLDGTARAAPAGAIGARPALGPASGHASEPAALRGGGPLAASGPRAQLLLFWAIGCLGGLASLAAGHLRFHTLVRRACPLDDPLWIRDMRAVGSRLGLRRDVRLVVSEAAGTPMTGGFRKPVVLLPASSAAWGPERRRVVLMHELVHVRRRDALRQLLSGVVLAVYWFHPLGWIACRLAAACREEACDERVLELGSRPSEYARHLVSLATGTTSSRLPVAALSMARQAPSRLEKRIMAILRPRRPRTSALVSGAVLTVTGLLGLSAAIAHPVPREQAGAHVAQADASVIRIGQPSSREIDVENPAASVAAPDGQLEAMASASVAAETVESAGGEAAEGGIEDAGNSAPPALRPLDLQEVNCYPPSPGRLDPIAFKVRTVPIGIVREGEDRFAGMARDGVRLCMRLHGDVEVDGGVPSIAEGGWVLLESDGEKLHRLIMRPTAEGGGVEQRWNVDGENRPFDELAREWRDGMLAVLRGLLEIDRIRGEESELEDRISGLLDRGVRAVGQAADGNGIVAGLQGQVAYRQSVVVDLLNRISYHQGVLSAMRDEIAYHRSVVSGMRDEIAMHRGRVAAFQEVKSSHEARITALIPQLKTADTARMEAIDRSIKHWEELIKEIEGQIEAYALQGKVGKIEARIRDYGLGGKVQTLERQISAYEQSAGFRQIEAAIDEETARLDEVTRRAEQAIRARETRVRDTGQAIAVSASQDAEVARLDEVARLEQQLRDLDADDEVEFWGQLVEDTGEELLELIRRL